MAETIPRVKNGHRGATAKEAKVFWFFFAKKNIFFYRLKQQRKDFFFEKKKQKTFVLVAVAETGVAPGGSARMNWPLPARVALMLDFDGTLVDIAPAPDRVVVPAELPGQLQKLREMCGGALAIVSGRPIAQIDALLGGAFAVAGEHGTCIRHGPDSPIENLPLADPPPHWIEAAKALVASTPGTLFEPKRHGFVLHYRGAPAAGPLFQVALEKLRAEDETGFHLLAAKMAWELRPAGTDKGTAVRALMARAPFTGRLPVFVGDDVTDEDGMRAAVDLGGAGYLVPEVFGDAAGVRAWIARLSQGQWDADLVRD